MSDNASMEFYYKPSNGLLSKEAITFLNQYTNKLYPKRLQAFSELLKNWYRTVVKNAPKGAYDYCLMHYTDKADGKYSFEESVNDATNELGLCISIEPSSAEEKDQISKAHLDETATSSVATVVAWLDDTVDAGEWEGVTCYNGERGDALVVKLIAFLKSIGHFTRSLSFNNKPVKDGLGMALVLVVSGVVNYHVKISWTVR